MKGGFFGVFISCKDTAGARLSKRAVVSIFWLIALKGD